MVTFKSTDNIVTVIVGIDGDVPPKDILRDLEESVNMKINATVPDFEVARDTVGLTINEYPSEEQRDFLGGGTLYIAKFDVNLGEVDVGVGMVNATHNEVVERIDDLGFLISGTTTVWDEKTI